jgi:uncharacterized protein
MWGVRCMSILAVLNDIFLKMTWLNQLSKLLVENLFRISTDTTLGGALQFFIYDVIKIFILLIVIIFAISYLQSYFPPERTKKILGRFKGIKGNIVGALLGTLTPFCSCSSIPIFIGFTSSGLPIGVTFSFLIASPFVNPAAFILLMSIFSFKVAILYVLVGVVLAVISGLIIQILNLEDQIMEYVRKIKGIDIEIDKLTYQERIRYAIGQVKIIAKKVWIFILIGVGIGSLIHNVIPQSLIENILGGNNPLAVFVAVIVGIPIYADIFGTIPIASALFEKGVLMGTILSFMMAVTAMSVPSMVMISKVVKPKLLVIFIGLVMVGIIIIGYIFNFLQPVII